ncbi:MAG: TrmH family RNA methyltransferase [Gammaproteobacteria bacterium]|nr:TrmH family RNA methyltransferase [Gammaproteobacteria bacterium]
MKHRKLTFDDHESSSLKFPVSILTDNITLTKNIGALFRLCDSLGIEHLYLAGNAAVSADTKLSKVSRFTERSVSHSIEQDALQTVNQLKINGYTIISLELTSHSTNIRDFDFAIAEKICLILGNESKGVNDDLLKASDHCVHIPMLGMNSSMNVICAASIAVFEITRNLPQLESW